MKRGPLAAIIRQAGLTVREFVAMLERIDAQSVFLKEIEWSMSLSVDLEQLAIEHQNEDLAFGGYGTTISDLARAFSGHSDAEIIAELKWLDLLGRVYLQYWDCFARGFRSCRFAGGDLVFKDFRLLRSQPI